MRKTAEWLIRWCDEMREIVMADEENGVHCCIGGRM